MFRTACRYPLSDRGARDALAAATGLVLAALILVRAGRALWPDALAVAALALAAVPTVLFAGLLGRVLRGGSDGDPDPSRLGLSSFPIRTGFALLAVAVVYLIGPTAILLVTVVTLEEAASGGLGRVGVTVVGTGAMVVALGLAYALPAGLAAAARDGLREGLRIRSLPGLRSGAYFAAWTGAAVLVALGWTALAAARSGTVRAVLAAVAFAYVHLAAARLVRDGLARATGRVRSR